MWNRLISFIKNVFSYENTVLLNKAIEILNTQYRAGENIKGFEIPLNEFRFFNESTDENSIENYLYQKWVYIYPDLRSMEVWRPVIHKENPLREEVVIERNGVNTVYRPAYLFDNKLKKAIQNAKYLIEKEEAEDNNN